MPASSSAAPEAPQTACVILARGGSQGVPRKNLRPVGGVSLIGRSVRAARAARRVDGVYVSTDSPEIAAEAAAFGARIVERPAEISTASASSESGWLHALPQVRADLPRLESLVFLQCTSPFTRGEEIDGCLEAMWSRKADCAFSAIEDHSFLWTLDAQGFARGMNHDDSKPRQRRQDLPPQFRESGAIYCVKVEAFERVGRRFCGPAALYPVSHPPVEIDSFADLALCAQIAVMTEQTEVSPERLAQVKALAMDFDGVHTDNGVYLDETGKESVYASRGDGYGLAQLRARGFPHLVIVSKERNPVVARRAEKLGIEVLQGIDDKPAVLKPWLERIGLDWADLLYVGNDLNDKTAMEAAGLSACPSDAHPEILRLARWILPYPGGRGALRALCDALIAAKA